MSAELNAMQAEISRLNAENVKLKADANNFRLTSRTKVLEDLSGLKDQVKDIAGALKGTNDFWEVFGFKAEDTPPTLSSHHVDLLLGSIIEEIKTCKADAERIEEDKPFPVGYWKHTLAYPEIEGAIGWRPRSPATTISHNSPSRS